MTDVPDLKSLTDELIAAWIAWDSKAARIGEAAQAHIDRGERPPRLPGHTLETEVRRLTAAESALGVPLGYTARIAALRWHKDGRPHMSVPDAVQTVVHELFPALMSQRGSEQRPVTAHPVPNTHSIAAMLSRENVVLPAQLATAGEPASTYYGGSRRGR